MGLSSSTSEPPAMMEVSPPPDSTAYLSHLLTTLSAVEHGAPIQSLPDFDHTDAHTQAIEASLHNILKRLYVAEAAAPQSPPVHNGATWSPGSDSSPQEWKQRLKAGPITPDPTPPVTNGRNLPSESSSYPKQPFFCVTCGRPPAPSNQLNRFVKFYTRYLKVR